MPTDYVGSAAADPGAWTPTTVTALNAFKRPTVQNGLRYKATSIGAAPHQTGGGEPAWPLQIGATVVDGNVTWTCWGALPAFGVAPVITLAAATDADNPAQLATLADPIADWLDLISLWSYTQEDLFAARGIRSSGRNIPAGAPVPGIGSYQANFSPQVAPGNATYVTSTAMDADASETAGQLTAVMTGTSLPAGATNIANITNTGGNGSNDQPEAVILFPMNALTAELFNTGTAVGFYWAPVASGWALYFQNGTGAPFAIGADTLEWSYVAIY